MGRMMLMEHLLYLYHLGNIICYVLNIYMILNQLIHVYAEYYNTGYGPLNNGQVHAKILNNYMSKGMITSPKWTHTGTSNKDIDNK